MRVTLELEARELQVTSFREQVAQLRGARDGTDRELDPSPGKLLPPCLSSLRPPDILLRSPKSVRPVAVEVITSKLDPAGVAKRILCEEEGKELGVIWVIPREMIIDLNYGLRAASGEFTPVKISIEDAVGAVLNGRKHVLLLRRT
jgi:hypothetical protein